MVEGAGPIMKSQMGKILVFLTVGGDRSQSTYVGQVSEEREEPSTVGTHNKGYPTLGDTDDLGQEVFT